MIPYFEKKKDVIILDHSEATLRDIQRLQIDGYNVNYSCDSGLIVAIKLFY